MWPWGHLAVAYLSYTVGVRVVGARHDRLTLLALVVGSQFPDLVDKPLTWVGVLPFGRSLAHSLLVLPLLCVGLGLVARRAGAGRAGWGFALGALSHVAADAWAGVSAGDPDRLGFLLWPLVPSPDDGTGGTAASQAGRLAEAVATPSAGGGGGLADVPLSPAVVQFALAVAVAALWAAEGAPGWDRAERGPGDGRR